MSAGDPGWYQDPGGQPGLRWWSGTAWGDELRPPGPAAPAPVGQGPPSDPAGASTPRVGGWAPGSTETRARFDPPRFETDALFQPRTPQPPPVAKRSAVLWVGLAAAAVILVGGIVLISGHSSSSNSNAAPAGVGPSTTTTLAPTATVHPGDTQYTDTGSLYTMAVGPNWHTGTPGAAGSATWTVTVDPATTAQVQVLPARLQAPQAAANYTLTMASQLDPDGAKPDSTVLYVVDGTGPDQLSNGTAAGLIHLHSNPLDPDNAGSDLTGAGLVTTNGTVGVVVLVLCPAANSAACLNAVLPYARTITLTAS